MDAALSQVLVSKEVLAKHAGQMELHSFYPSPADAQSQVVLATNSSGRYRISANSVAFGAASNFTVSSSSILYGLTLNASLTTPADTVIAYDGWLFSAIQSIEITLSNSVVQNQVLSGISLRDYVLATCTQEEERINLLKMAGQPVGATTQAFASIPIVWMLQGGNGICGSFPLDMSTLNGPIQITINWYPSSVILSRTGGAPGTIAAFDNLTLTGCTTELNDALFGVRNAMMANPGLTYPIPCKYLNSINYSQSCAIGVPSVLNLSSAPSGMLEAIILTVKPQAELTANSVGTVNYPGGVELSSLRLSFGGTDLFRADTIQELEAYYRTKFCGDVKKYQYAFASANSVAAADRDLIEQHVYVIPLSYDAKMVMSAHKIENLTNYGGSTLQLTWVPAPRQTYDAATPFASAAINPRGGTGAQEYVIQILYVCSGILEISASSVNLVI